MKGSFEHLALALALTPVFSGVGAGVSAADATGTASATVIAPAQTGELLEIFATTTFISGVTGDLTIHIPGLSRIAIPSEHLNSVPFELFSIPESVCPDARALAGCLAPEGEPGLLQGDPVHDILVNMVANGTSGEGSVRLSLNYN